MNRNHAKQSVLVIDAAAKSSIPVIESCAALGLHVIAAAEKRFCCGFYSRHTRERVIYPPLLTQRQQCLEFLIEFLKKRSISMIFPLDHDMTAFLAEHQDALRQYTRLVLPPYDVFFKGLNKNSTLKAAEKVGCPIPRTWFPQEQSLAEIARETKYPCLVKPAISVGARGITYCHSPEELLHSFPKIEAAFGESSVQEFVPQTGTQYKTAFILGYSQELLAAIVYSKIRYYPPNGGSSTLNMSVHRPDILESALKVARELQWVGPCDCDYITDPRDNVPKLMEINPRLSDTFKMTAVVGMDWTKIIYQLAMGQEPLPQLEYPAGKYLRFLFGDCMWFLKARDQRWHARPSFLSFFRPDTSYLMTGTKDWGPFLGYTLENLSMLWDKQARQYRLRLHNMP